MHVQERTSSPAFTLKGQDGKARNHWARLAKAANHPASAHEAMESGA